MRRIGYVFELIISIDNLRAAHEEIKRAKKKKRRLRALVYEENLEANLQSLHDRLANETWNMHDYTHMTRCERGKPREIWYSCSHEDSIVQHAILRMLGPLINKKLIRHTYASIKGRGTHDCVRLLTKLFKSIPEDAPVTILKADIYHFYDTIDHQAMDDAIDHFIKEQKTARLLKRIIHSFPKGLPIGNALSPLFANMLLSQLDHYMKEQQHLTVYHRYLDDIVAVAIGVSGKKLLRLAKDKLVSLVEDLNMTIKKNLQIFPLERYGLDFLGYVFKRKCIRLRKSTERRFRRCAYRFVDGCVAALKSLSSYWGTIGWISKPDKLWFSLFTTDIHMMHKIYAAAA